MEIVVLNLIKCLVNAFFAFFIYSRKNEEYRLKGIIRIMFLFPFVYAIIMISFGKFINEGPVLPFVSTLIMFTYFWIESKNIKEWKLPLTYSVFICLLIEFIYMVCFHIVSFTWDVFRLPQISSDSNLDIKLTIFRMAVVVLSSCFLFLIYKFRLIKIKTIEKISKYTTVPIFLMLNLIFMIYLKYHLKYAPSDYFYNVLSFIFLIFIPILFAIIFGSEGFVKITDYLEDKTKKLQNEVTKERELKEQLQKEIEKSNMITALEDARKQIKKGMKGLQFTEEKYKLEHEYFKNKLEKILGMDEEKDGTSQAAFGAVLLKQHEIINKVNFSEEVYIPIAETVGIQESTVYRNIENAIKDYWNNTQNIKKIEQYYPNKISPDRGVPTPREFLIYIVNEAIENEKLTDIR